MEYLTEHGPAPNSAGMEYLTEHGPAPNSAGMGYLIKDRKHEINLNMSCNMSLVTAFGFPYAKSISKQYRIIWSFFPPNLLAEALTLLAKATSTPQDLGISWSRRAKCTPNDDECVITIDDIYKWLVATFVVWFVLAIYFDNIIPNVSGVRKSVFYFLNPGYWLGRSGNKVKEGGICSCIGSVPPEEVISPDDEDVLEEENLVKQQTKDGVNDPNIAVQIRGLRKTYPGSTNIGCCKCKKNSPYQALRGLWVNFAKDQLFCLLGPNGAGKTTAINCLTGITPVTSGDALIYGLSVRSSIGMSKIRKLIGVCPQFDILWDALSGKEHLHLFASIKGLRPSSIKSVCEQVVCVCVFHFRHALLFTGVKMSNYLDISTTVKQNDSSDSAFLLDCSSEMQVTEKSLAEVRLTEAAKMRAGSYSGGMKRRLSVAIALIGDPKLVILDEPTTGMDPITRRHVWDIIENAKKGRAIVLTTHSMEEADILSDGIGIMAKGRLRCIGTSIRLKSRFGTGFIANVSFASSTNGQSTPNGGVVSTAHHEAVKQFFKHHLNVVPKEENKSFLTFVIPHDREVLLPNFFTELQERASEFGIADIQLGLTTLEEVFLNIAKQAELETATAEGRLVTLTLATSGTSTEIPVGARFVGIPGTESAENPRGNMVEVYWDQDESGTLCISGHSDETPVPPNIEPLASLAPATRRGILGRGGVARGIVLDPDQIIGSNSH
ncbi:ABC transporter A, ABCA [Parasponia andersonii]|uniref:ABC transporter A, ABCA n=1 Tax=Parasponia andersonii TaxID=3476 RepID=A0A2P5C8E7_PARAD|nr:ABC transporter A, ABCA [Parasponia andersonii]